MTEILMCAVAVAGGTAAAALVVAGRLARKVEDLKGLVALNSARLTAQETETMSVKREVKGNGLGLGVVAKDISDLKAEVERLASRRPLRSEVLRSGEA